MVGEDLATGIRAATVRTRGTDAFFPFVTAGATLGVGSLPHLSAEAAAAFALDTFDIATIPSLPRRSPAEARVAQALVGTPGIALGQYGALAIDVAALDPTAEVLTDLCGDTFVGFRTFLERAVATGHVGPVKWQFVGPISVGLTLRRAGAPADVAFRMAQRAVRGHLVALSAAVSEALPSSPQLVVLDEPFVDGVMAHDFPIAPDEAVDLLSSALAVVEQRAAVGIHSCGDIDLSTLISTGPGLLSLPASTALLSSAGYVDRFLAGGGWIAWGAVATEGPIGRAAARIAADVRVLWRELESRGCDPDRIRAQSLISPQCGLGGHSISVAARVCETVREVATALASA